MIPVHYNNETYYAEIISPGYATNGNTALLLFKEDEPTDPPNGYVVSVNIPNPIPTEYICIKNWSENAGIEQPLIDAGIIEEKPINYIPSGMVSIPVYPLTDKALATLQTVREP